MSETIKTKKKVIENPKGTITIKEAMLLLKGKHDINKQVLRAYAVKDGFKSKRTVNKKESFLLDVAKFNKWIKEKVDVKKEKHIKISEAARELSVSMSYVYKLAKENNIEIVSFGCGRGRFYIDFPSLKKVVEKRKGN